MRRPYALYLFLMLLVLLAESRTLLAQKELRIGNRFINAFVIDSPQSLIGGGRFYMQAGPDYDNTKFLYSITSSIVFRVRSGNDEYFFTNANGDSIRRPVDDRTNQLVPYLPFDSIYSAAPDSVVVVWKHVGSHRVTMRIFTEKERSPLDDGGDIVIEFSYTSDPFFPSELGIFLMLDTYNSGSNSAGGQSDRTSLLTDRGYFPVFGMGRQFTTPYDTIPEFYHVGDFTYQPEPTLNDVLPIHRMRGFTHGGLPLTPPTMFAIGSWDVFKQRSWEIGGNDLNRALGDCATVLRWNRLFGNGTVRTAFGLTDRKGNNLYHCRDSGIFIDIRTERLIEQKKENGPYLPSQFDVEMWVTNTSINGAHYTISLMEPIGSGEDAGRLAIDPSTAATQSLFLPSNATGKLVWRLNLVPGNDKDFADLPLDFRYFNAGSGGPPRILLDKCRPMVAIKRWRDTTIVPPVDTLPPPIELRSYNRNPYPLWSFQAFDRHRDYLDDTGLDTVIVEENDGNNVSFSYDTFLRCDTTITTNLRAQVIDTTKLARMVFAVRDCYGNVSRDSVRYDPRPDIFPPEIDSIVTVGGDPALPCNAREYYYYLVDSLHQTPEAGDYGFGSIETLPGSVNFELLAVNFERGYAPIRPYDPRATFRLRVLDSMQDASARVRVVDFAGNADTIDIAYCTIPDTLPPVAIVRDVPAPDPRDPARKWDVTATDRRAWDRGLESIVVLSNVNMNYTPPAITPGDEEVQFNAEVIDGDLDGELLLEVRDRYYDIDPSRHATLVRIIYMKTPDTLAPNILFRPVPGSNGAVADVEVNDIHYFGSELYRYDRGLATVRDIALSSNMKIVSPIAFAQGDKSMSFRIMVEDTLKLHQMDSICLEAIDLYNNRSSACYYYPIPPDILSPLFTGAMSPDRKRIAGEASDSRTYDRGLGEVRLENGVNVTLEDAPVDDLNGIPRYNVGLTVADPTREVSGTLVVRDLIATLDPSFETQETHALRIRFVQPAVHLRLRLPIVVESGDIIRAALIAAEPFDGSLVRTVDFSAVYRGEAAYSGVESTQGAVTGVPAAGRIDIRLIPHLTRIYQAGDTLGSLLFTARGGNLVEEFHLEMEPGTLVANEGNGRQITVGKQGDRDVSVLGLPAPYAAIVADSVTYINGDCERVLNGRGRNDKANGFVVLSVMPQPVTAAGGLLHLDIRNLPAGGATAELLGSDGSVQASFPVPGSGVALARVTLRLPAGIAAGAYFLRLRAGEELAWVKVIVVE